MRKLCRLLGLVAVAAALYLKVQAAPAVLLQVFKQPDAVPGDRKSVV
mgnify:CR=1 FL=1